MLPHFDGTVMPISFKKAPLVELVAELRWVPFGAPPPTGGGFQIGMGGSLSSHEEFYARFGSRVQTFGFAASERLMPPGFPATPYQVVYRFKRLNETKELLQVGPGVFSANALRPYQSWLAFRPSVAQGIDALLASRANDEADTPFVTVALRYIDAFTSDLTGSLTPAQLIRDVFGIKVVMPDAISQQAGQNSDPVAAMRLAFATAKGQSVAMSVGEGVVADGKAVVVDTTVTAGAVDADAKPIEPSAKALMAALDEAREVQHSMFVKLTERIHDRMEPEGRDG
jgi:uncharacterized protein (TIGR04255 family)